MKKSLFLLLSLFVSMPMLAEIKEYVQEKDGNIIKYKYDTETHEAWLYDGTGVTATKLDFILPEFTDEENVTYQVTRIGEKAFTTLANNKYSGNINLDYVIIPKGIYKIEANAFNNCSNIRLLELSSTMTTVATNAFIGCSNMAYVCCKNTKANSSIPMGLPNNELMTLFVPKDCAKTGESGYLNPEYKWVEGNRFKDRIYEGEMKVLYSKTENMTYVCASGPGADHKAILIEGKRASDVEVKSNVDCEDGESYNVVGIGKSAFYNFLDIHTLKIGEGVTTICNNAFQKCANLKKLELPSTLNTIGAGAFAECNNLRHVWCKVVDATLIDATRFPKSGMMSLYVPNTDYRSKGNWSAQFGGRIYLGDMVTQKDGYGNEYVCSTRSHEATLYIGQNETEIDIPSEVGGYHVTGIDRGAFSGLTKLHKVIIPNSITTIGSNAFYGCNNLTIVHSKSLYPLDIDDNVFSSKAKATLFIPTSAKYDYTQKPGWNFSDVQECDEMFEYSDRGMDYICWGKKDGPKYAKLIKGTSSITEIGTFVNSYYKVISIGESAFSGIRNLESLTISGEIETIADNAFKNCYELKSITLPSTLKSIGKSAFQYCIALKKVTLPSSITTIGDNAFNGCTNLVEVESNMSTLVPVTSTTFPNDIILYIPSDRTEQEYKDGGWIYSNCFLGHKVECQKSNMTYVYGSSDPADRKEAILLTCSQTSETVDIRTTVPDMDKKVISIAKNAFLNNNTMKNLIIPEGVESIGAYAFKNCSKLTTIVLPSTLSSIRNYAFAQCSNITKITSRIEGTKLFALEENVFPSIVPTIYIPGDSKEYYTSKEGWKKFENSYKVGEATPNVYPDGIDYMAYDCYSDDYTATLTKITSSGNVIDVVVPATISVKGTPYTVTAIGESIFDGTDENKSKIQTLVIGDNVKTIGANAFKEWKGLHSLTLPDGLVQIGQSAFQGDNNADFKQLTIPNSVTTIAAYAFQGCTNLQNVKLPENLKSIENHAFANITVLETIDIPNSVDSIGAFAFQGCFKLNIKLPKNLKSIGDNSFENISGTISLSIPEGVERIGAYAFRNCSKLNELVLPSSLLRIDPYAFADCANITNVISKIKEGDLFEIDKDVFPEAVRNAATLFVPIDEVTEGEGENESESKTIAKYQATAGWKEFQNMIEGEKRQYKDESTKMVYEYLTGPHTATLIGTYADSGDVPIESSFTIPTEDKPYQVIEIGESAFSVEKYPNTKNITTITISDGINKIGANAFKGCTGLISINIPGTMKTIGANAFQGCTSLVKVNMDVPSVLETIESGAFMGCSVLRNLDLPSTLKTIGPSAFQSSGLQKISLPSGLNAIGDKAFYGCSSLSDVGIERSTPLEISEDVFSLSSNNTATLFVPKESKSAYDIVGWNKFSNVVEGEFVDAYTDADLKVNYSCYRVKKDENKTEFGAIITKSIANVTDMLLKKELSVKVEGSEQQVSYTLTHIGKYAFNNCTNLKTVELPSSLISIGDKAFANCSLIREVVSNIEKGDLFTISDDVFHADAKSQAKLYVPIGSKETYEGKDYWSSFTHDNIENGKWEQTENPDEYYLKYRYHTGKKKASVIEIIFPEDKEELTIPSSFTIGSGEDAVTYDVNSISPSVFNNKNKVRKLTIEDVKNEEGFEGISSIGTNAFQGCSNLQKIWLPKSVKNIGSKAFYGCNNLIRICIESMPTIENTDAFTAYSNALLFVPTGTMATLGAGWRDFSVKYEGYYEDESPDGVSRAYIYLKQTGDKYTAILTNSKTAEPIQPSVININNNKSYDVTIIGKSAFTGKVLDLSEWTSLPESVVAIENEAFKNCKLKELALPSSLKTIGNGAFCANNQLVKITLPANLNTLGDNAFKGCSSLEKIELPKNITTLGAGIFEDCSGLTEVISKIETKTVIESNAQSVPNAILYVPEGTANRYSGWDFLYTLEGDSKLARDVDGLDYAYTASENSGNKAILIGVTKISEDGAVTIPESVTIENGKYQVVAIGKDVLNGNLNLKKLEIKASLASIGENAFSGCSNLSEIICDKYYKQLDALSQFDVLLYVPNETIKKSYVDAGWNSNHVYVGDRVEKEFEDGLKYVYTKDGSDAVLIGICDKDKAIDKNGAVIIPDYIEFKVDEHDVDNTRFNVISVANSVFKDNTDVRMVTIGENIASIGENTFEGCTNLKEIVSKISDPDVISKISFSKPDAILFITDANMFDTYKAKWDVAYILVGERRAWNENGLYYTCATIDKNAILLESKPSEMNKDVDIPGSIEFKVNDNDEENTTFNVIAIAENAFKGNTDMNTLTIEKNIKTIGASAFQGCIGLNKIWLPESLDSIAEKAFNGCNDISYICTKRATPQESISANVFSKTTSTLYVPYGSIGAYSANSVWGSFSKIKEGKFVDAINQGGVTYECVINDKDENVAQIVKAAASLTEVIIPSEVEFGQTSYRVAGIEDKAFEACTKLTVITSKISKDNLFGFNENVYPESIYKSAVVYVPNDDETEAKYKTTDGWKKFEHWARGEKKTDTVGEMTYDYLVGVGTATLTKTTLNTEKVRIDGTVKIDGVTYTVTAIGANAFKTCNKLKMVWLPSTLKEIDKLAFAGCYSISYVSCDMTNPCDIDANTFPSTTATLLVPNGYMSNYEGWKDKFAYMAEGEFVDVCTDTKFSYDCVKSDGKNKAILRKYLAYDNEVEILGTVNLSNVAYTVATIAKSSFENKNSITSLVIPAGVEEIDEGVFSGCSKLIWIQSKIEAPIDIRNKNVFNNSKATLFIPSSAKVDAYTSMGWNFLNIFLGEKKETTVDGWTYTYSTGDKKAILTKVGNVGKDVTINGMFTIGKDEYTVTSVVEAVFKGKTNIEALTIAKSIENIGANAFDGCNNLTFITCEGTTPPTLGANAFPSYSVTVNVPNDAVGTYKNHPDWKPFGEHILGITTSVEDDPTGAYNILPSTDSATPEVELWNGSDAEGDVVLTEIVTIGGSDFTLTAIAANAYDGNTAITSIVIPSTVNSIGASAFAGCTNLKSITVNRVTPIDLSTVAGVRGALTRAGGSSVFEGVNKETCILYVPAESIDAYKQATGWKDFKKIYAIGTTAINGVVVSEGKPFDIYNLQGRKVKANTTTFNGLPSGVYIVNGKKVMVK